MTRSNEKSKQEEITLLQQIVDSVDFTPGRRKIIKKYLNNPEPKLRMIAIEGLWEYPEAEFLPLLFDTAKNDPEERVRCRAIVTLGRYVYEGEMTKYDFGFEDELTGNDDDLTQKDYQKVNEFLFAIYADKDKSLDERRFALEALSFCSDQKVLEIIQESYTQTEPKMKLSAIFGMGRNGNVCWADTIHKELYNTNPELQREAIRAAGEMGLTEAGKDLWRLTYSEDRKTQMEAIWSLGQSGWENAFERLDELTLNLDPEIQETAEAALEEWNIHSGILSDEIFDENGIDSTNSLENFVDGW